MTETDLFIDCGHGVPEDGWLGPDGHRVFCQPCAAVRLVKRPVSEPANVAFDELVRSIAAELWKLAPITHQEAAHVDITFLVTMQDLFAAVENGIAGVAE